MAESTPPDRLVSYDEIHIETWRRLQVAADDRSDAMHLLVVTTVSESGDADARTLVLRGIDRDPDRLWFHTDVRSAKVRQLQAHPRACAVGYDPADGVQLRIVGSVNLHHDGTLADQHWEQMQLHARHPYAIPIAPGQPLPHHDPRMRAHEQHADAEQWQNGRRNFSVIELLVESIDWLQVGAHSDRRAVMHAGGWLAQRLVP